MIRTLNVKLLGMVGYDTKSELATSIMLKVFIASFVNTGIILLIVNADLKFAPGFISWFHVYE